MWYGHVNSPQTISVDVKFSTGFVDVPGFLGCRTQVPSPWFTSLIHNVVKDV
jgi:hypothetical protein